MDSLEAERVHLEYAARNLNDLSASLHPPYLYGRYADTECAREVRSQEVQECRLFSARSWKVVNDSQFRAERVVRPRSVATPGEQASPSGGTDTCGETESRPVYTTGRIRRKSRELSDIRYQSSDPSRFALARPEWRSSECTALVKAGAEAYRTMSRQRELSRSFRRSERCRDSRGHNLDKSCWSKGFLSSLEGAPTLRSRVSDRTDCPRAAKPHRPIRKGWRQQRCSRPDRASSIPNDSGRRHRPADCDDAA